MGYIAEVLEMAMSYLTHEKEMYKQTLARSPEGGLIYDQMGRVGKQERGGQESKAASNLSAFDTGRYLQCIPIEKDASGKRKYRRRTLREKDTGLLIGLACKEYAKSALRIIEDNLRILTKAMAALHDDSQEAIINGMRQIYRELPITCFQGMCLQGAWTEEGQTLEQKRWAQAPYEQSKYRENEKIHITSRGLAVRSRAELLIAEMLYQYNIPFRYEQELVLEGRVMAPDFTFLGGDGREFYWEYCGMMGNPDYVRKQLWRRGVYEGTGITEWDNMIYTYDAKDGIDMREIEAVIRTKILPRLQQRLVGSQDEVA